MGLREALKAKVKAALLGDRAAAASPSAGPSAAGSARPAASSTPKAAPSPPSPRPAPAPAAAVAAAPPPRGETSSLDGFRRVADASAVREGRPGTYAHAGLNVAVFRHAGRLYAIDNACAHEDGPIGEGAIDGPCVRCPYHDWQYDFTTGACLTDPERNRATFAVREADGGLWLGAMLTAGSESRGGEHDDGMEVIRQ